MKGKLENHEPQALSLLTRREQVEQGGTLCLVQEPIISDFATRGKPYSQILAVMLRHNKKFLNQSRANAFNNPPVPRVFPEMCPRMHQALHCPAGT